MLIAQHRAHVRILFERYMAQLAQGDIPSQQVLFAEDFELSPAQNATLLANMQHFTDLGFALSDNGKLRWSVTAIPAPLSGVSPVEAILTVLDRLAQEGDSDPAAFKAPLALAMARAEAVKSHQPLSQVDMDAIIADLFRCSEPDYTPDGLPVLSLISNDEISTRFEI